MATNQQRKERQRRHILATARQLFLQDGYKATHVAQIAARADVSQVTLYKYFESKQALGHQVVLDLITQGYADNQAFIDDPTLTYPEIIQKMMQFGTTMTAHLHPSFYEFMVADMQGKLGNTETMRTYQAGKRHFWQSLIDRGRRAGMIRPTLSDQALMLYLDMYISYVSSPAGQATIGEQATDYQALTDQIDHLFFYGFIGVPPTQTKEGTSNDD